MKGKQKITSMCTAVKWFECTFTGQKAVKFNPETIETSFHGTQTPGRIKDSSVLRDMQPPNELEYVYYLLWDDKELDKHNSHKLRVEKMKMPLQEMSQ